MSLRSTLLPLAVAFATGTAPDVPNVPDVTEAEAIAGLADAIGEKKERASAIWAAVEDLRGFDSPAVAEVLGKAFQALEGDAESIDRTARDALDRGKLSSGETLARRKSIDPIRGAQAQILDQVLGQRSDAARLWMVEHWIGDDRCPFSLKLHAAMSAGQGGAAMVEPLGKAFQRAKKPDDVVVALVAAQSLERIGRPLADAILPYVAHADASVRENAALALAKLGTPKAIEPLIQRIEIEEGRTQVRFAEALEVLTGQKFGLGVNAWKSWFAAEGARYTSGAVELGVGTAAVKAKADGYFHGIPQDSRSIVYVIDVSGSMIVSLANPRFEKGDESRPLKAPAGEESRMSASKKELVKALGMLPPGAKFNIVAFANSAQRYSPRLVEASPGAIKKAQLWVEDLEAGGATNIHDGLESAFGLGGRGTFDRYYDAGIDTIFLLTDGQPTLPNGRDHPERILTAVKRLNPFRRVVVHAIGLGAGNDDDFLKRLAEQNGGVYVKK